MSDLYEVDVLEWSEQQAALLRRRAAGELVNERDLDWTNIAEEIEDVGKSQRAALASQVRRILEHLMKLDASPALDPQRGWQDSIDAAQAEIEALLEDTPSLRRTLDATIARELPRARRLVARALERQGEAPRRSLEELHYNAAAVLGD